ncbi:GNAT family N-acetyltransferase [Aquimarina sp. AU474]|uniref:GNAT family N-acetyltransferase n=1 Tax=Aquimarina sp. AU474 TaxID=2108529 RepID=UPI000D68D042|nr:GNAT family N-acetyltransferase [Aquimarina sp. AU474]
MEIRQANLKDIPQLSLIFDSYRVFYRKKPDVNSAKAFLGDRIMNKESIIYIVENDEGSCVGFVQLYPIFSSTRMKKLWLLNDLYVYPDFRGQKISIQLIDKAKELAVKSDSCGLILETEKTNMIGNNLYPKTGFVCNKDSNFYTWDV